VALSFKRAQTGDVGMGDVAGGNISKGISPDAVLRLLQDALSDERQYRRLLLAAVEQLQTLIQHEMEIAVRLILLTIALTVVLIALVIWVVVLAFLFHPQYI
jgi:hypothetical protein